MNILVINEAGKELGYLVEDLFISNNITHLLTEGKIPYDKKEINFFEKGRLVLPSVHKKFQVLDRDYTAKSGNTYIDILSRNKVSMKRFAFYGVSVEETKKNCEHYLWAEKCVKYRYAIYDTKQDEVVGYLLTSTDLYNTSDLTTHICMLEIKNKRQGIGSMVIRELLKYKPIRGLADSNSKPFWSSLNVKYMDDNMHFSLD